MRRTYLIAAIIALVLGLWLLSGQLRQPAGEVPASLADQRTQGDLARADQTPAAVRASTIHATARTARVSVRGRTENKRTVALRAETSGRLVNRPVDRGDRVDTGDLLCELAMDDREARLDEAKALLHQAEVDYRGARQLGERGLQAETALAAAQARLATARAGVARAELDYQRREIRAPFPGLIDDLHAEVGDLLQAGNTCATLVDLHPMLLVGRVPERRVNDLSPGIAVQGRLLDGTEVSGTLRFVSSRADPATRTYAIEVEVPNADFQLRSGITTDIQIPVAEVQAHKVAPGLLTLDDDGQMGLRIVTNEDRVAFAPVQVIDDDPDGQVWVTGLPPVSRLITVGQELVVPGERVRVVSNETSDERSHAAEILPGHDA